MRLTGSRTKRQTVAMALEELVKAQYHRVALTKTVGAGVVETTEAAFRRRRRSRHGQLPTSKTRQDLERQTEAYYRSLSKAERNEDRHWTRLAAQSARLSGD